MQTIKIERVSVSKKTKKRKRVKQLKKPKAL